MNKKVIMKINRIIKNKAKKKLIVLIHFNLKMIEVFKKKSI